LGSLVQLNIVPSTEYSIYYKIAGTFIGIATPLPDTYKNYKLIIFYNYLVFCVVDVFI